MSHKKWSIVRGGHTRIPYYAPPYYATCVRMCVCMKILCIRVSHVPYHTAPSLLFILYHSLFPSTCCSNILPGEIGDRWLC